MLNQWKPAPVNHNLLAYLRSFVSGLKLRQVAEMFAAAIIIIPLIFAATHAVQLSVTGGDRTGNALSAVSGTTPFGGVTTFEPNDPPGHQRVDAKPGDRTASYCNADNIGVYGVLPDGTGISFGEFTFDELKAAGPAGITRDIPGFGTVSAVMDSQGDIYVAWNGGFFGATGQGDYAKTFKCS